ncbi:MAG TPA: TatD family hydrolase [Bacteroidales bacterium]|nr:TatD family hydrolase [Bacteroidales bacterium]
MTLIDTHTHLYLPEFDEDRDKAVERAVGSGVSMMLMPNIDIHSADIMLETEQRYKGICHSMIGLHPTSVKEDYLSQLDKLEEFFTRHKFIAIGEIGIDLYWDKTFISEQLIAFRRQIAFAIENDLPVVIHSRDSFPEVFSVLEEFSQQNLKGVLHAFTGTADDAKKGIAMGLKLGIGGIVTFKNSGLDKVIENVSPEDILLETDSPYLAPSPHRGKRNESSYICIINKKIADIYRLKEEEVAEITSASSLSLFNL